MKISDNRHPHELISASFDVELSPKERAVVEAHLVNCPDCRALIEDLPVLRAAIASETPPPPPESLAARVSWRIASAERGISHAPSGRRWYASWPPLAAGGLAAALLLTFVLLRTDVRERPSAGPAKPDAGRMEVGKDTKRDIPRELVPLGYARAPDGEVGSGKRAAAGKGLQEAPRAPAPEDLAHSGAGKLREADAEGKSQFALGGSETGNLRSRTDAKELSPGEDARPTRQSRSEPSPAGPPDQRESDRPKAGDGRFQRPAAAKKAETSRPLAAGRPEEARTMDSGASSHQEPLPSPSLDEFAPAPSQNAGEGALIHPGVGANAEPASPDRVAPPPPQAPEPAFVFVRDETSKTCKLGIERPGGAIVIRADDAGHASESVRDLVRKLGGSTETVTALPSTLRVELPPARAREFFAGLLRWGVPPLPPDFPEHPMVKPDCFRLVLRFEALLTK